VKRKQKNIGYRKSRSDNQTGKEDRCFSVRIGSVFVSYVYFHSESLTIPILIDFSFISVL